MAAVAAAGPATYFGWRVFGQLLKLGALSAPAGAFISPLSLYLCLVLALNGAGPNSSTQKELWAALNASPLPLNATTTPAALAAAEAAFNQATSALQAGLLAQSRPNASTLTIANGIWAKNTPVLKPYADAMLKYYAAPARDVPSAAPINAWAANATNGLIKQAVPPGLDFDLVLTNAVYFLGKWEYAFDKAATRKARFVMPQGPVNSRMAPKELQVDMMSKTFKSSDARGRPAGAGAVMYAGPIGAGGPDGAGGMGGSLPARTPAAAAAASPQFQSTQQQGSGGLGFRAVKLPYRGSTLAAIAVLPDLKKYPTVEAAAADLSPGRFFNASLWSSLYALGGSLEVQLPKFSVEVPMLPMGKALQAMGVTAAFDDNKADFSRLSSKPLFVSDVLQSAVVKVDEAGTEAAAVTSVIMATSAFIPSDTPPLVFDRPFIFLIVDDASKTVLFHGFVRDPTGGKA